jgi:hypothetical protein
MHDNLYENSDNCTFFREREKIYYQLTPTLFPCEDQGAAGCCVRDALRVPASGRGGWTGFQRKSGTIRQGLLQPANNIIPLIRGGEPRDASPVEALVLTLALAMRKSVV